MPEIGPGAMRRSEQSAAGEAGRPAQGTARVPLDRPADSMTPTAGEPPGRRARRDACEAERLVDSGNHVRSEVVSSWRRCQLAGISPDDEEVPHIPDLDDGSRLLRAATPVIDHLAEQLSGEAATIILADARARILDRRAGHRDLMRDLDRVLAAPGFQFSEALVGTNGIGSALEEGRPFLVAGEDHFRENLRRFACMGAPVRHPMLGTIEGIMDVTCRSGDANGLLQPLVLATVREIEARLCADSSLRERVLLEHFLRRKRRCAHPLAAVNEELLITNTMAAHVVDRSDHAVLWQSLRSILAGRDSCAGTLRLGDDRTVEARCVRVEEGGRLAGIVVELVRPSADSDTARRPARVPRPRGGAADDAAAFEAVVVGRSDTAERLRGELAAAAATSVPLLLLGEPGVGKLFAARALHERSGAARPATVLDAGAAADDAAGWIERATAAAYASGTLVVRHLELLPPRLVPELAALLEQPRPSGARVIGTSRHPDGAAAAARLCDYFPARVELAPLRVRPEDIADLARVLLRRRAGPNTAGASLQPAALQTLMSLDWPGNIRELDAVLACALQRSLGADISLKYLPAGYREAPVWHRLSSLARVERETILATLADTAGNKLAAAQRLGIARSTLYRKMRALGIDEARLSAEVDVVDVV